MAKYSQNIFVKKTKINKIFGPLASFAVYTDKWQWSGIYRVCNSFRVSYPCKNKVIWFYGCKTGQNLRLLARGFTNTHRHQKSFLKLAALLRAKNVKYAQCVSCKR